MLNDKQSSALPPAGPQSIDVQSMEVQSLLKEKRILERSKESTMRKHANKEIQLIKKIEKLE